MRFKFLWAFALWVTLDFQSILLSAESSYPNYPTGEITLEASLEWALEHNPSLKTFRHTLQMQEGIIEQAGVFPNPELDVEFENSPGTGNYRGAERLETSILIRQMIERGNKRGFRVVVAEAEKTLLQKEYETSCYEVLTEVARAFIDLISAQERRAVREEFHEISTQVLEIIRHGVELGRYSPVAETRARVQVSASRNDLDRSALDLEQARLSLAKTWGGSTALFNKALGNLFPLPALPDPAGSSGGFTSNPDLASASAAILLSQAELGLERAKALTDIVVGAGVRHFAESADLAFVFGVSIPLPMFNRNQGAIRSARDRLAAVESEYQARMINVQNDFNRHFQTLQQTFREVERLEQEILPDAESAFRASQDGFQAGKFSYLEVLDAQGFLYEARLQRIEAAQRYHKALNELNRLIAGSPLMNQKSGRE